MTVWGAPATSGLGMPVSDSVAATAGVIVADAVPVRDEVELSVTVTDWSPAVLRMTPLRVWAPASAAVKV